MANQRPTPAEKNDNRAIYILAGIVLIVIVLGFVYMNDMNTANYSNVAPSAGAPESPSASQ